jgi:hypothetical protein
MQGYLRGAPLTNTVAGTNEPLFSLADWTRNFILQPPFSWRWNRAQITFSTVVGQNDYTEAANNFGWLEKAFWTAPNGQVQEMTNALNMAPDPNENQPKYIGAVIDDDNGGITFRIQPAPDQVYSINVIYQKSSPNFQSVDDLWTPIPDYLSYIVNDGIKSKMFEYWQDSRQMPSYSLFLRELLAVSEGLDDSQKNLFLWDQLRNQSEAAAKQSKSQGGSAGRIV